MVGALGDGDAAKAIKSGLTGALAGAAAPGTTAEPARIPVESQTAEEPNGEE